MNVIKYKYTGHMILFLFLTFQSCVPVDIMPGEYDPTNQFLPQQPLHKCMFPTALSYSTVQGVPNPYKANIGGLRCVY